jgi:YfaZ precursor
MKRLGVAAVLLLATTGLDRAWAQKAETFGQARGTPYVSGGVGLESRATLRAKQGEYNLMVILSHQDGHYLGGAALAIRDQAGRTVLKIGAKGPWIFARLPPGTYTVDAKAGGTTRSSRVVIGKKKLKRIHLIWENEPDGSNNRRG